MAIRRQHKWILSAVMGAIPAAFGASIAHAQYLLPEDGHALDANNFQGANGRNDAGKNASSNGQATGNQIITGNVTGGRQFRGVVQYTDPQAFRGPTVGGISDSFIKNSYGAPERNAPAFSLSSGRTFYGASRAVAPPVGTVREGFTGAYVGTSLEPTSLASMSSQLAVLNQRLGAVNVVGVSPAAIAQGSDLVLPPPGEEAGNLYVSSPLLGPQSLQTGLAEGAPETPPGTTPQPGQPAEALLPGGNGYIDRFSTGLVPSLSARPGTPGSSQGSSQQTGTPSSSVTPQPLNTPLNPLPQAPLGSPEGAGAPDSGLRQRLIVPAAEQSAQYKELQQRFTRMNGEHAPTAEEANRQFQQLRAQQQLAKGKPGQPGQPAQPGGLPSTRPATAGEGIKPNPNQGGAVPLHVESVAGLTKSKDLHDLMDAAEKLMRDGQFGPAIAKYDAARRISRDEPLVSLGRANAELGAGLYTRALFDLRHAFGQEPALVMGQYDLKSMLTPQRVEAIQKDLDALSKADVKSAEGPLLSAYVAYNSGDPAAAARYLEESGTRVGNDDALLELMRTHWALPGKPQELNK